MVTVCVIGSKSMFGVRARLLCPHRRGGALSDTAIRPSVCPSGKTGVGTVSGVEEANRGSGAGLEKPGFST